MKDLTEIDLEGEFASSIREHFHKETPLKIIETGTFQGRGSTTLIASLIRDIPLENAKFISIEVNPHNLVEAFRHLHEKSISRFVTLLNGLSIPRDLLPSKEEIESRIQKNAGIKMDHEQDPSNASEFYHQETKKHDYDDGIGYAMKEFEGIPDFVLLDSAAHLGKIEFDYLILKLKGACTIALDDTKHFKHHESLQAMKLDKRFEFVHESDEKFGSAIVKFTPS